MVGTQTESICDLLLHVHVYHVPSLLYLYKRIKISFPDYRVPHFSGDNRWGDRLEGWSVTVCLMTVWAWGSLLLSFTVCGTYSSLFPKAFVSIDQNEMLNSDELASTAWSTVSSCKCNWANKLRVWVWVSYIFLSVFKSSADFAVCQHTQSLTACQWLSCWPLAVGLRENGLPEL